MADVQRLAVLGTGVMGGALARGLVKAGIVEDGAVTLYDVRSEAAEALAAELSPNTTVASSARAAVKNATTILLAVKPQVVPSALGEIKDALSPSHLIISIAAGVTLAKLQQEAGDGIPIVRAMPNLPALIGEGATAVCGGIYVSSEQLDFARTCFSSIGKSVIVEEKLIDAVTGLSGSGPAYVFLLIEAMIDGGVKAGLPRDIARTLAAQTVLGASKMLIDGSDHPAQLKDRVTTPGGTTITGLALLESKSFRGAIIEAIEAAAKRAKDLS